MVERIRRSDLSRIVKDYNNDRFVFKDGLGFSPIPGFGAVNIANRTSRQLMVGEAVCISGLMFSSYSYDELVNEYMTCGILCAGTEYSSSYPNRPVAVVLEPLNVSQVGKCLVQDIMPAVISGYTSSKNFANLESTGFVAGTAGDYWIIGVSSESSGNRFGYVSVVGSESGHLIGYISGSDITGPSSRTSVTLCDGTDCGSGSGSSSDSETYTDIRCPILRSGETIESGTVVVISKNLSSGEWEIIEAQCPED